MRRIGCMPPSNEAIDENVAHAMGAQLLDGRISERTTCSAPARMEFEG